jgi:hypothetical protein
MAHRDDELPRDLQDISARLIAARVTPTELELDDLRGRAHRQARAAGVATSNRGFAGTLRSKLVAVGLTVGLLLTTGVGVGVAFQSFGGHDHNTFQTTNFWPQTQTNKGNQDGEQGQQGGDSFWHDRHADYCEYLEPHEHDYDFKTKYGFFHFFLVWDCEELSVHFFGGHQFTWEFNKWGWNNANSSVTTVAPTTASSVTVHVGGSSYTVPLNG